MYFKIENPIVDGCYADPEARFYEGKYIIYTTISGGGQKNQTCFSSTDLSNWEKHENIIDMSGFPWVKRAIWAPTIIEKDGRYYYIFASNDIHDSTEKGGLEIGVSDSPTGPFKALLDHPLINEFHNGAQPIDAHLFKDDDGIIYLFYGGWGHCNVAKMSNDMTGFVPFSDGSIFKEITPQNYVEGPCMFKRNGRYYFMWSSGDWTKGTYCVYASTADAPTGPFENCRQVLSSGDGSVATGPGHNGYIYIPEEDLYLIAYHRHHKEQGEGNKRFLCIDRMCFDDNGYILPVEMTNEWEYKAK